MNRKNNTLLQEELYLKQISQVDVPEETTQEMNEIINSMSYGEQDIPLRRFVLNYCLFSLILMVAFPQLGIKMTSVDISSILNGLGSIKHLISGFLFTAIVSTSVIIFRMTPDDMQELFIKKRKEIYLTMIFSILTFSIFGTEIGFLNIILWIVGSMFGLNFGLKLGIQYLEESNK